jgi:hypothetical protein
MNLRDDLFNHNDDRTYSLADPNIPDPLLIPVPDLLVQAIKTLLTGSQPMSIHSEGPPHNRGQRSRFVFA